MQYVTFSYLDPYTDVEWEGYFDQARGVSWTHVKEIARNCVALKTYVVHGPIIAADVPKS